MSKFLKIFIIAFTVILVGTIIFLLFNYFINSGKVIIDTPQGAVKVKDFPKIPTTSSSDQSNLVQTDSYDLIYFIKEGVFQITLLSQPIKSIREQAEQELLDFLQVNQADACKLNVLVKTPFSVDQQYAGLNLGLSFCPDAVKLK